MGVPHLSTLGLSANLQHINSASQFFIIYKTRVKFVGNLGAIKVLCHQIGLVQPHQKFPLALPLFM